MFPEDCRYTNTHEWIRESDEGCTVGITAHAAEQLGDVTYVELPQVNAEFKQGDAVSAVESVKAASDVYAPAGGRIAAVNDALEDHPELVNQSPYDDGWFFRLDDVDSTELEALMDAEAYESFVAETSE
jgi:glycine cleavage system H protein